MPNSSAHGPPKALFWVDSLEESSGTTAGAGLAKELQSGPVSACSSVQSPTAKLPGGPPSGIPNPWFTPSSIISRPLHRPRHRRRQNRRRRGFLPLAAPSPRQPLSAKPTASSEDDPSRLGSAPGLGAELTPGNSLTNFTPAYVPPCSKPPVRHPLARRHSPPVRMRLLRGQKSIRERSHRPQGR